MILLKMLGYNFHNPVYFFPLSGSNICSFLNIHKRIWFPSSSPFLVSFLYIVSSFAHTPIKLQKKQPIKMTVLYCGEGFLCESQLTLIKILKTMLQPGKEGWSCHMSQWQLQYSGDKEKGSFFTLRSYFMFINGWKSTLSLRIGLVF